MKGSTWKLIGEYKGAGVLTTVQCQKCKSYLERTPNYIRISNKCGVCTPKSGRKISVDARAEFVHQCKARGYKLISEYVATHKQVTLQCKNGHDWTTRVTTFTSGSNCPHCYIPDHQGFRRREVTVKGRVFKVQGYEDIALQWLVRNFKVKPKHIVVGTHNVERFRYRDVNDEARWYYPDFRVGKDIIEVKSTWTCGLDREKWGDRNSWITTQRKARAVLKAGFFYALMIFRIKQDQTFVARLPENWIELTRKQVLKRIEWVDISKHVSLGDRK